MAVLGLKEAYESAKERLNGMTFDQFKEAVKDFKVHPMFCGGKLCGAVLVRENNIHACIEPWAEKKWFGRKAGKILNRIIDQYGEAITTATTDKGKQFVERLGFEKDGEIYRGRKKWELKQY